MALASDQSKLTQPHLPNPPGKTKDIMNAQFTHLTLGEGLGRDTTESKRVDERRAGTGQLGEAVM